MARLLVCQWLQLGDDTTIDIRMESTRFYANERAQRPVQSPVFLLEYRNQTGNKLLPRVTGFELKRRFSLKWKSLEAWNSNQIVIFGFSTIDKSYFCFASGSYDCNVIYAIFPLNRWMKGMSMRMEQKNDCIIAQLSVIVIRRQCLLLSPYSSAIMKWHCFQVIRNRIISK